MTPLGTAVIKEPVSATRMTGEGGTGMTGEGGTGMTGEGGYFHDTILFSGSK